MNAFDIASIGDNKSILIVAEHAQKLIVNILESKPELHKGIITTQQEEAFQTQIYRAVIHTAYNVQAHKDAWFEKTHNRSKKTFAIFDDFEQECFHVFPSMRPYVLFNRSYSFTSIVSLHKATALPPNIRSSFDIVFVKKREDTHENLKLHEHFFRDCIGLKDFVQNLDKYEYLVAYLHSNEFTIGGYNKFVT